ncbi:riboflavin synthase [Corynebacterium jeikeium]|uniref:riboflavin synthase n=1 Tax=Corynebacterium jeikeium TaxID=38289 RepID=UPI0001B71A68|nr:riboflavin synthase [Corynebacterium jeikeium]EEW16349.1 riboflavin synthase, alpha subunit [Corynebacterium jeikeium ATCC 43734]OOD34038.1 riboflavin synthase [Corynebacterium jeikeium]WCZ53562.1 Riboflavin synthase [Corynebacterium jeikeium]SUY81127.1 riboflavin synthase subunit alpha [Corynebacterium jeikeium]
MFTGIIEEVGRVAAIEEAGDSLRMRFTAPGVLVDAKRGDSIAINGVCLTVAELAPEEFTADVMQVTLDYSALGGVSVGDRVNVERAMASGQRFGGHIVQGHVDGTATLQERRPSEHWEVFRFRLEDPQLARYVAKKGSVALNGTSLTVAEVAEAGGTGSAEAWFEVSLIPTTLADTMLGDLHPGDTVNVECDVLAKYVERLAQHGAQDNQ